MPVLTAAPAVPTFDATTPDADDLADLVAAQKAHFRAVAQHTDAAARAAKIERLRAGVLARRTQIQEALYADFRKPALEVDLSEIQPLSDEARFVQRRLARWMRPQPVATPPMLAGTASHVVMQPKGVALILAPWNYPVNLTLSPLVGALAAGCCAVLKPSEHTPHASAVMRAMIEELFDPREVAMVEGDAETAKALLAEPFDHVYFTGGPAIGSKVMGAAAEQLASVTLELGGKSPAVVDETADLEAAARTLAWGKFTNAGQTCIAPDYVLVHERAHDALVAGLARAIHRSYGRRVVEQQASADYARLVHDAHFERVRGLFTDALEAGATLAAGGATDPADRFIAPTVLTDVPPDARIMQEEIFGPVLPVIRYRTLGEAIAVVNGKPNPLALYVFSESEAAIGRVIGSTSAGGTCVNEVILHYANPHLPFGGAGHSGIGKGHGYHGFRAFSNERAVLRRHAGQGLLRQFYPPYDGLTRTVAGWVRRLMT